MVSKETRLRYVGPPGAEAEAAERFRFILTQYRAHLTPKQPDGDYLVYADDAGTRSSRAEAPRYGFQVVDG